MESAIKHYQGLEEPQRSKHLWKYTSWRKIHPTGKISDVPQAVVAGAEITNLDGSSVDPEIELVASSEEDFSKLRGCLGDDNVTASFCRAISSGNALTLKIPKSWKGKQPLAIDISASGHISTLHILLDIGDEVEVEIATSVRGEAGWFGLLREGVIGHNSRVSEFVYNRLDSKSKLVRSEGIMLSKNTIFETATLSLGTSVSKSDLRYALNGSGSELGVFIAAHGTSDNHDDHHIEIEHVVGNNRSQVEMHAACDGKSRTMGTGKLMIAEASQGADASQVFRNLLLSDKAKADAIPELEVLADDVSANHGAATAPLDPDQTFYLQSRGLDEQTARDLIVEGFLMDAFSDFTSRALLDRIRTLMIVHLDCDLI